MRKIVFIFSLIFSINVMAQFSSSRLLLLFNSEANEQLAHQQLELLNNTAEQVKERAVKVIVVEKESPLYKKYRISVTQFTVILVGKDGFEKYRTDNVLKMDNLFAIIDAMPMRRSEMKKN